MKFITGLFCVLLLVLIGCSEPSVTTREQDNNEVVGRDVELQKPTIEGVGKESETVKPEDSKKGTPKDGNPDENRDPTSKSGDDSASKKS